MTKYTARFADGTIKTRKSARTYTHAFMLEFSWNREIRRAVSFAGSEELARKTSASMARTYGDKHTPGRVIEIVPVQAEG